MNVLIAPDAFKDSLTAQEAADIMQEAVLKMHPQARCYFLPASDGGEGFLEAVQSYRENAVSIHTDTLDPLRRPHAAHYLYDSSTASAYIELAQASGLELLKPEERNPLVTSTFGTGLQIKEAIAKGAQHIYVGLGGSATNDAGTGIAQANGYVFKDKKGQPLDMCGEALGAIDQIDGIQPNRVRFYAINDVSNPLYGPEGAAFVYARQKGATDKTIEQLDLGLRNLDRCITSQFKIEEAATPGSGAAGGTAYGLKTFFKAEFISGTSFILNLAGFQQKVKDWEIDLILTGEGKIDAQTHYGKFVFGLAQQAAKVGIPVKAVCGKLDLTPQEVKELGLQTATQLYNPNKEPQHSFKFAKQLLFEQCCQLLEQ